MDASDQLTAAIAADVRRNYAPWEPAVMFGPCVQRDDLTGAVRDDIAFQFMLFGDSCPADPAAYVGQSLESQVGSALSSRLAALGLDTAATFTVG